MNLFQKINQVCKQIKSVHKGSTVKINERSSYTAVSHDDVTSLLHDPIAEVGLVAFPNMEGAEVEDFEVEKEYQGKVTVSINYRVKVWASVTFINADKPDERITTKCFSYALDSGDKATGKAYSMAIKYCYLKTFMLESLDEEESRDWEQSRYQSQKEFKPNYNQDAVAAASDKQKELVKKLYPDIDIKTLTRNQASELIQKYNKGKYNGF